MPDFPKGPLQTYGEFAACARPRALKAVDLNGDGRLDLIVGGGQVRVFINTEVHPRQATVQSFAELEDATDFAVGDFDEDGYADIGIAEHDAPAPQFLLLRGSAEGTFAPAQHSPFVVAAKPHLHTIGALDFDRDGHLDLVVDSWPESRLVLVRGHGDGTFALPGESVPVPPVPIQNLACGDMDGDGFKDVVTPAHDRQAVSVLLSQGDGTLQPAAGSPFASAGGFTTVGLADFDLDGDLDVLCVHRSDASTQYKRDALSLLHNDGKGRLSHAEGSPHFQLPERSSLLAIGDLNGDGYPEALALSESSNVIATYAGGKDGLRFVGVNEVPGKPRGITCVDWNGDGRMEVLISDLAGGSVLKFRWN